MNNKFFLKFLIKFIVLLIGMTFLQSCSESRYLRSDFMQYLTNERFSSGDGFFSVNVPLGWFGTEDNSKNIADLMLVKEDYSAAIFVNKISAAQTKPDLQRIMNMAISFRKVNNDGDLRNLKKFKGFFGKEPYFGFSFEDSEKNFVAVYDIKKNNNIFEATLINFDKKNKNQNLLNSFIGVLFSLD